MCPASNVAKAKIVAAVELEIEDEPPVQENGSATEFTDCLIDGRHRALGCRATATFDTRASKLLGFVPA